MTAMDHAIQDMRLVFREGWRRDVRLFAGAYERTGDLPGLLPLRIDVMFATPEAKTRAIIRALAKDIVIRKRATEYRWVYQGCFRAHMLPYYGALRAELDTLARQIEEREAA